MSVFSFTQLIPTRFCRRVLWHCLWVCCIVLQSSTAAAQDKYLLVYQADSALPHTVHLKKEFSNKTAAQAYVQQLPAELLSKGWLSASVDSVLYDSTEARVWLYTGKQYYWGRVDVAPGYILLLKKLNAWPLNMDRPINGEAQADLRQQLLDYFSANGHPFASVGFDSVVLQQDSLSGQLVIEPGPFYKIDSIHLQGSLKLKRSFLSQYLHIPNASAYNQHTLDKIDQRLSELAFAEATQPASLSMVNTGAVVNVYLQARRSNIINVLLGLMPASTQTPDSKLQLTGDVNILLNNAFAAGESLGINWQQLQYKSPRINLFYNQPYMLGTAAGVDLMFDLLKKDSQFVNVQFRAGIPYEFNGSRQGKLYYQQQTTILSFVDTNAVKLTRQLPELADISSSGFGLDYGWNNTDYKFNPHRGGDWLLSGVAGIKKIKPNSNVTNLKDPSAPAFNFASLYDTVKMKTYQLRLKARLAQYLPLSRMTVLKLALNAGWYQSQNYFRNELFQIGGYKLLRGFDEESVYARSYAVFTAEFRLLSGRNSYFFAFADGGSAQYKDVQRQYAHRYLGTGLGLAFEAKNSMVNLSWALGRRNDLPFDFRQSKIHLGFVNYF